MQQMITSVTLQIKSLASLGVVAGTGTDTQRQPSCAKSVTAIPSLRAPTSPCRVMQKQITCANVTLLRQLTQKVTAEIQGVAGAGMGVNVTVPADCDYPCGSCSPDSGRDKAARYHASPLPGRCITHARGEHAQAWQETRLRGVLKPIRGVIGF